jgi:hypothetical protein
MTWSMAIPFAFKTSLFLEAPPSTLSSRPKRSGVERSAFSCLLLGDYCSATTVPGSAVLPFVISTGAYPDFLLRAASYVHVCGSP